MGLPGSLPRKICGKGFHQLTKALQLFAVLGYFSPQQMQGEQHDQQSGYRILVTDPHQSNNRAYYGKQPTRKSPRRNDFNVRFEAIESKFEANLVIAFTGAPMRNIAIRILAIQQKTNRGDGTYSHFSFSAIDIMPRAITGRARDVPRR